MKTRLVFFGTPEFSVPTLEALHKEGYDLCLAVTQPDKPVGRKQAISPSPVKRAALKPGLKVLEELKSEVIKECSAEAGIVVAYGKIIPAEILNLFPKGCLNIHPSLLPKYRGPSPIQSAILNGDKETGVSIIKLDEKMDHGPMVACVKEEIGDLNAWELSKKLAESGARLLINTLPGYLAGEIKPIVQDDRLATFTKILKREDGQIDWHNSALEIERQIRAYYPWPGSYAEFEGKKVKILKAASNEEVDGEIGTFQSKNGRLIIRCQPGSLIVEKLQPEGKKPITAKEFINGYL